MLTVCYLFLMLALLLFVQGKWLCQLPLLQQVLWCPALTRSCQTNLSPKWSRAILLQRQIWVVKLKTKCCQMFMCICQASQFVSTTLILQVGSTISWQLVIYNLLVFRSQRIADWNLNKIKYGLGRGLQITLLIAKPYSTSHIYIYTLLDHNPIQLPSSFSLAKLYNCKLILYYCHYWVLQH